MIRKYNENDLDSVLEIWLTASVSSHDFISAEFWESQVENMRNIYIPASEVYVYEMDSKVVGFYALYESHLAAIFVTPKLQVTLHPLSYSPELTLSRDSCGKTPLSSFLPANHWQR